MIQKQIIMPCEAPVGCILVLPGRDIPGTLMEKFMFHTGLWKNLQIILEPQQLEWYPQPKGPEDQENSVAGLERARDVIGTEIKRIKKAWGFKRQQIAIVGFSAGAVMALDLLVHSKEPFAGIISLAGAILEPDGIPKAKNNTPILLQHNMDDLCFKWEERYLPMLHALKEKGYNVTTQENVDGGHILTGYEVDLTSKFMRQVFDYRDEVAAFSD